LRDHNVQEVPLGTTTFTGPVKAGTIPNTSGSTLGRDVRNTGWVLTAQSSAVTQASGATDIVIPANSQIVDIKVFVTVAFTGVATTFGVGTTASATFLTAAAALDGAAVGPLTATPGTDATRNGNWIDVGTTDRKIAVTSTNTGSGVANIVVTYLQNRDAT
jgi:hypothetical protein